MHTIHVSYTARGYWEASFACDIGGLIHAAMSPEHAVKMLAMRAGFAPGTYRVVNLSPVIYWEQQK